MEIIFTNMKKTFLTFALAALTTLTFSAVQAQNIFSISTAPGENASTQIGVSWATSITVHESYLLYTVESDKDWNKAVKVLPQQEELCTLFQGINSVKPDGTSFYEDAVFVKCGASLSNLVPDTDYKYVIVDATVSESPVRSNGYHFRTAGTSNWSACIISDFHSYTPLPHRLEVSMGMIDKMQELDPSLDFVFSPGDVVAWGGSYSFWKRLFEEPNFEELMWARVNGNHDNWTKESSILKSYDLPNDFFRYTSFFPQNSYKGELGVCYHFRYGNTLFIMLNSEDLNEKKGELEEAKDWVRSVVSQARQSDDAPTFVVACMHYHWFAGTSGKAYEYELWSDVFDEMGIDLAVAGNNHVYVRSHPLYEGKVVDGKKNGTVYIQTTASDNDRGRSFSDETMENEELIALRWTEGPHSVSAIHLQAKKDKLSLTLMDRDGNKIDSCEIQAKKRK